MTTTQKFKSFAFSTLALILGIIIGFVAVLGIFFVIYTIPRGGLW